MPSTSLIDDVAVGDAAKLRAIGLSVAVDVAGSSALVRLSKMLLLTVFEASPGDCD